MTYRPTVSRRSRPTVIENPIACDAQITTEPSRCTVIGSRLSRNERRPPRPSWTVSEEDRCQQAPTPRTPGCKLEKGAHLEKITQNDGWAYYRPLECDNSLERTTTTTLSHGALPTQTRHETLAGQNRPGRRPPRKSAARPSKSTCPPPTMNTGSASKSQASARPTLRNSSRG